MKLLITQYSHEQNHIAVDEACECCLDVEHAGKDGPMQTIMDVKPRGIFSVTDMMIANTGNNRVTHER